MKNQIYKTNGIKLGTFLIVFLLTSMLKAQDMSVLRNSTPEERASWQTELMKENLKLSEEQLTQVSDINLEYAKKIQPIMQSNENNRIKIKRMKSVNKDKDAALKTVLSKEQYEQYQRNKAVMQEKMKERMKEKKGQI